MASNRARRVGDLFERVANIREQSEVLVASSRITERKAEAFHQGLVARAKLTEDEKVRLSRESTELEDALRNALQSDVGLAQAIATALASVRLEQPEHVGLIYAEAERAEAFATSLRSKAAAMKVMHEMRRRIQVGRD